MIPTERQRTSCGSTPSSYARLLRLCCSVYKRLWQALHDLTSTSLTNLFLNVLPWDAEAGEVVYVTGTTHSSNASTPHATNTRNHLHTRMHTHNTHLSLGECAGQLCGTRWRRPEAVDVGQLDAPGRFHTTLYCLDLGEAPELAVLECQSPRELMPGVEIGGVVENAKALGLALAWGCVVSRNWQARGRRWLKSSCHESLRGVVGVFGLSVRGMQV